MKKILSVMIWVFAIHVFFFIFAISAVFGQILAIGWSEWAAQISTEILNLFL